MNIALITAGGTGTRTGNKVPKQFLTINDVPLIVYTMKNIQKSGLYDELYVVCNDGWSDFIASYAMQYSIDIFKSTISGGSTRFKSYYNGLKKISNNHDPLDIISVLDGNRPMTPERIFVDSINTIKNADCVLPLEPCFDSMYSGEKNIVLNSVDRNTLYKGQSPETTYLGTALKVCEKAIASDQFIDKPLAGIMLQYGLRVYFVEGSRMNFKITTNEDFVIFKTLSTAI